MRRILLATTTLLLGLAIAAPVAAGGWAVTEADTPAPAPAAGITTTLGFTILQHGVTPAPWVTATLALTNAATGARIEVPMRPDGSGGHFLADVTFPEPGEWTWAVALAELGSDSTGSMTVLGTNKAWEAFEPQVAELEQRLESVLARVVALEQRLAELEAATAAAQ